MLSYNGEVQRILRPIAFFVQKSPLQGGSLYAIKEIIAMSRIFCIRQHNFGKDKLK